MISLVSILIYVLVSLGGMFFFTKKKNKITENEVDQEYDHLLCRFVMDGNGRKIGESVSIYNDIMIIKAGAKFLGVPLKHVEERGKTILVKGLIDFERAYDLGEEWHKESFQEINQYEESEGNKDEF